MTDEEVFQTLLRWAMTFGCDVCEADKEELQADGQGGRRGVFRKFKRVPGRDEEMEIVLQMDLPLEEKVDVLAHEVAHLALLLLQVSPEEKLTREPIADLLGKCLVATIREDWGNPLLRVGGTVDLIKQFLELLNGKMERTLDYTTGIDALYRWRKKEAEGNEGTEVGGG